MLACEWNVLERPNNLVAGEGGVLGWLNQPASGPSWSPTDLTNAWAWYDPKDTTSLFKDASENTELVENKLVATSDNFLNTVGTSGAYASTPYESAYSITGDIDIRAKVTLPVATQGAGTFYLLTRWSTGGNSWLFRNQGNRLWFTFTSAGGTTSTNAYTTVDLLIEANVEIWYRVVRTKSDGVITFYKSTDDAETWEQIGAPRDNADGVDMYVGTSEVRVGTTTGISRNYRTHRAQIYNNALGDGTGLVYDADFSVPAKNALSFTESSDTGATVTINGAAKITNAGVEVDGEIPNIGLMLDGTNGNCASIPDNAAFSAPSNLDMWADITAVDNDSGSTQILHGHYNNITGNRSYYLSISTGGDLSLTLGDAASGGGSAVTKVSTAKISTVFANLERCQVRGTWEGTGGLVNFYTRANSGAAWAQLGTADIASGVTGALHDAASPYAFGANGQLTQSMFTGNIYRAVMSDTIGGAAIIDADFTRQAKLATEFTESASGLTVTINQTAIAFPARIHGDRDMYQGTSSKLPTFSTVNGRTGLLFDGSNDYIKTASANLTQPVGVYYAGEVVAWSLNKRMLDGEANLAMDFYMGATTPNITIHAGAYSASTAYPVGAAAIMTAVVNGASTDFRLNKTVGSVGTNAGTVDPLGFTVGAAGGGGSNANIFMSELILTDTTADDTTAQDVVIDYMATANSISV
jgi:hypothetical protein